MSVPEPITDELFASPDERLASALDNTDDLDVAAELVALQGGSIDDALERVETKPIESRATVMRAWTDEQ